MVLRFNLLGHGDFLQISVWRPSPWQSLPPIWGVGELQRRILVMTPSPQVTEHEDQGDQWLQPPSCLTVSNTYIIHASCSQIQNIYHHNSCVAEWLTAFVTFLGVAVTGLDRGALTVAVDAITGASTLLDAASTSHWTMRPFRPGGPTIICRVTRWREQVWAVLEDSYQETDKENLMKVVKTKLTWCTARATLSFRHSGISTWNQRAGDFATHSSWILNRGTVTLVQE